MLQSPETNRYVSPELNSCKRHSGDTGRCTKQASKRTYKSKERQGPPNRYTEVKDGAAKKDPPVSVQQIKKVRKRKTFNLEGCRLMDIQILEDMIWLAHVTWIRTYF